MRSGVDVRRCAGTCRGRAATQAERLGSSRDARARAASLSTVRVRRLRQHDKRTRASSRSTRLPREASRSRPRGSRYRRASPVAVASLPPCSSGVRMSMTGAPACRSGSSRATSTWVTSARSGSLATSRAAATRIDLSTDGSSGHRAGPGRRMQDCAPDRRTRANPSILGPPRQIRVTSRSRRVLGRSTRKHHLAAGTRPCRVSHHRHLIEQRPCARNPGAQPRIGCVDQCHCWIGKGADQLQDAVVGAIATAMTRMHHGNASTRL